MKLGQTQRLYLAVGTGAALGAILRYLVGLAVHSGAGLSTLYATGAVNVTGSFIIMFFATMTGPDGRLLVGPVRRQAIMTGFCGGLTTFSSMSLDTFLLLQGSQPLAAGGYLLVVIALSLVACWAGYVLAARLNAGAFR
jgi:fluoride exporter